MAIFSASNMTIVWDADVEANERHLLISQHRPIDRGHIVTPLCITESVLLQYSFATPLCVFHHAPFITLSDHC